MQLLSCGMLRTHTCVLQPVYSLGGVMTSTSQVQATQLDAQHSTIIQTQEPSTT
jgi:hypothetical protein